MRSPSRRRRRSRPPTPAPVTPAPVTPARRRPRRRSRAQPPDSGAVAPLPGSGGGGNGGERRPAERRRRQAAARRGDARAAGRDARAAARPGRAVRPGRDAAEPRLLERRTTSSRCRCSCSARTARAAARCWRCCTRPLSRLGWAESRLAGPRRIWREAALPPGGTWGDFADWIAARAGERRASGVGQRDQSGIPSGSRGGHSINPSHSGLAVLPAAARRTTDFRKERNTLMEQQTPQTTLRTSPAPARR